MLSIYLSVHSFSLMVVFIAHSGQSQFAAMAQYVLNQLTAVKRTLSEEDETNAKRKVGQLLSAMKTDLYDAPYVRPPLVTGKALGISYLG